MKKVALPDWKLIIVINDDGLRFVMSPFTVFVKLLEETDDGEGIWEEETWWTLACSCCVEARLMKDFPSLKRWELAFEGQNRTSWSWLHGQVPQLEIDKIQEIPFEEAFPA